MHEDTKPAFVQGLANIAHHVIDTHYEPLFPELIDLHKESPHKERTRGSVDNTWHRLYKVQRRRYTPTPPYSRRRA